MPASTPAPRPRRPWQSPLFVASAVALAATLAVVVVRERWWKPRARVPAPFAAREVNPDGTPAAAPSPDAPPPVLFQLPDLGPLVDQDARPFTLESVRGRVWVASFFFTSCPTICPKLMARLRQVADATAKHGATVRVVSFSVDPKTDTPARLTAYARKLALDTARWSLVTGPLPSVERAVREGFKQALDRQTTPLKGPLGEDLYDITHAARFVLIDGQGALRGFYESDDAGRADLLRHVELLVRQGGAR